MVNGAIDLAAATRDLAFQRGDPRLQLRHGKTIEILAQQRGERIVGPGAEDIVQIHVESVDRRRCEVNKRRNNLGGA